MPQAAHICTMTDDQRPYENALRNWLQQAGYGILASDDESLPTKLDAAARCDVCFVVLGRTFAPRDPLSSFSDTELEVAAAADANAGKILAFFQEDADNSASSEQREFIERLRNFATGLFQSTVSSPAELLEKLPGAIATVHVATSISAVIPADPPPGAMMISSTGKLGNERAAVRAVLEERGIYPIDYLRAASEAATPIDRVISWARNCEVLLLILGARYGYVSPVDGLGVTELEFATALRAHRPILAFIADHPTDAADTDVEQTEDQRQFIERVQIFLAGDRIFHFANTEHLQVQVRVGLDRLDNNQTSMTTPNVPPDLGRRWYQRQIQRWLGRIPHLTRPEGMPLKHVYVALQAVPTPFLQRKAERESENPAGNDHDKSNRADEQQTPTAAIEVDDALRRYSRMILEGDPGSGKSVVLRWYAITASPDVVPIYIRLSRYGRALQEGLAGSLLDYLMLEEQRLLLAINPDSSLWRSAIMTGHALILLDALDEVAEEPFDSIENLSRSLRSKVRNDILEFASQVPSATRIVVTTRLAADSASMSPPFTVTQLQPLDAVQQRRLVEQWLTIASGNADKSRSEIKARTQQVLNLIHREPNVASLARRPLMLVLLTALSTIPGFDLETNSLTKAVLLRRALRLMLGQWGTVSQRRSGAHLWAKEQVLIELARRLTLGEGATTLTPEDLRDAWSTLPPNEQLALPFTLLLEELVTLDGILLRLSEQEYTFYHSILYEYLGATWLASRLPDAERIALIQHWRLFAGREETTQLLVTELDRLNQVADADRVVRTLIESDIQPLFSRAWADPVHLALARAARCQGSRSRVWALGGVGPELARAWGSLLRSSLSYHDRRPYLQCYAGEALAVLGPAAIHANSEIQAALTTSNEARRYLLESTVLIEDPGAETTLLDIYRSREGSHEERLAVLRAIGKLPQVSKAAHDLLYRVVAEKLDESESSVAAEVLVALGPTRADFDAIQRLGQQWRIEAMNAIPDMPPEEAVDILRHALYGTFGLSEQAKLIDAHVRLEAIRTAGELGAEAAPVTDQLLTLVLRDIEPNAWASEDVVFSIGSAALPSVRKLLNDRYIGEGKFGEVLRLLDEYGTLAHPDVQRVVHQALMEYREDWRRLDAQQHAYQPPLDEKTEVHGLKDSLQRATSDGEYGYYIRQIGQLGSEATEGLETFRAELRGERRANRSVARDVLYALEHMGSLAAPALGEIGAVLDDEQSSADVRHDAIRTIAGLGRAAEPALARLRKWLHDPDWVVRSYTAEAIGHLGSAAQPAILDLVALIRVRGRWGRSPDPHDLVRTAALRALAELWPTSASALPQIQEALRDDTSGKVRVAAAQTLGQIGQDALPVLDTLHHVLSDSSTQHFAEISQAAAQALYAVLSTVRDVSIEPSEGVQTTEKRRLWRFWGSQETK